MTKLAFITDPHLDHAHRAAVTALCDSVKEASVDAVVITGDIAQTNSIFTLLPLFQAAVQLPVYFVLGNHDYYRGHTVTTREKIFNMCRTTTGLHYMRENPVQISKEWSMVGVDGWADARHGTPERQKIQIADWAYINDYNEVGAHFAFNLQVRMDLARKLADVEADLLSKLLERAVKDSENILVLTHIPPFREATWHAGELSNNDWLPWFSCKATGDVLMRHAEANPGHKFKVLCGHTHSKGRYAVNNVEVITGASEYGWPRIHEIINL